MRYPIIFFLFGLAFANLLQAQPNLKEWAFVNQKNGYVKTLKQNQKITVRWSEKTEPYILWGLLVDISEDSLYLKYKKRIKAIANKDITKIKYKRKRNLGEKSRGVLLFLSGTLLLHLLLNESIPFISEDKNERGFITTYFTGTLIGLGMIIWGFVLLKSPQERISDPFRDRWRVQEISSITPNQP